VFIIGVTGSGTGGITGSHVAHDIWIIGVSIRILCLRGNLLFRTNVASPILKPQVGGRGGRLKKLAMGVGYPLNDWIFSGRFMNFHKLFCKSPVTSSDFF